MPNFSPYSIVPYTGDYTYIMQCGFQPTCPQVNSFSRLRVGVRVKDKELVSGLGLGLELGSGLGLTSG